MNPPLDKVRNIFFTEDTQHLTLDNYFDCLVKDQEMLLKYMREAKYQRICFIRINGKESKGVDEKGRHQFETYQSGVCFQNSVEDKSMFRVNSTVCPDPRLLEIYSYYIAHCSCNILTVETGTPFSALPVTPGVIAIAPTQSIRIFLENQKNK